VKAVKSEVQRHYILYSPKKSCYNCFTSNCILFR